MNKETEKKVDSDDNRIEKKDGERNQRYYVYKDANGHMHMWDKLKQGENSLVSDKKMTKTDVHLFTHLLDNNKKTYVTMGDKREYSIHDGKSGETPSEITEEVELPTHDKDLTTDTNSEEVPAGVEETEEETFNKEGEPTEEKKSLLAYGKQDNIRSKFFVWPKLEVGAESIMSSDKKTHRMEQEDFDIFQLMTKNDEDTYDILDGMVKWKIGEINSEVKLSEDAKRTAALAGVELTGYLGNYGKFFNKEEKAKPSDPSNYPKVEDIKFNNPDLTQIDVEFHDGDDMEYQKFATGEDVYKRDKVKVPDEIKEQVNKRIEELKEKLETHDQRGFDLGNHHKKAVWALEKIKKWLDEGSVEAIMNAQILYSTLATQYAMLIPPKVINFIHTALFPYTKDKSVNLDHDEREQTNKG